MNAIKKSILLYLISDYCSAAIAWFLFLIFRKSTADLVAANTILNQISSKDIINILLVIPTCWVILHLHTGAYFNLYRKSRLNEILRTIIACLIGAIMVFFIIVVNDKAQNYGYFPNAFFTYLAIQFCTTIIGRNLILNKIKSNIKSGQFSFNTLMIGGNTQAVKLYSDIKDNNTLLGNNIKGFVYADDSGANGLSHHLPNLGSISNLETIINQHKIDEVLIAIDTEQHHKLQEILTRLSHGPTVIKILPDMYDIISGSVKTSNVLGAVLIEIYPELMPDWQRVIKRTFDITMSILVMLLFAPLYVFVAIRVKLSSQGPIFFNQERIGLYGKPFQIHKFRSMYTNAEEAGPALSKEDDPRITPWGRTIRKWRLDEIPQFYNVLIGDMSLVGPRPERQFFINQLSNTHPHYKFLHKVKPGITSWGMVKYGYASNLEQMKERMKYDLLYIKNCSLALDTKILFYTIVVILQGRGK
jgi:polysaccharide biosynthesis protein PslA